MYKYELIGPAVGDNLNNRRLTFCRPQDEAATWRAMRKHVMVIADATTDALGKQFPDRFQDPS